MWQPWVGSNYQRRRLLLLGESFYDWSDKGTGETVFADAETPTEVVRYAMIAPQDPPSHTIGVITRAICGTESPSVQQSEEAWESVAYTNYVPVSVGLGPKQRPTRASWKQAGQEWQQILDVVTPHIVVVFGYTAWNWMGRVDPDVSKYVGGFRASDGSLAMCWAVPHPAARGNLKWTWQQYAEYIAQAEQDRKTRS